MDALLQLLLQRGRASVDDFRPSQELGVYGNLRRASFMNSVPLFSHAMQYSDQSRCFVHVIDARCYGTEEN
jgi:hypothetical protein